MKRVPQPPRFSEGGRGTTLAALAFIGIFIILRAIAVFGASVTDQASYFGNWFHSINNEILCIGSNLSHPAKRARWGTHFQVLQRKKLNLDERVGTRRHGRRTEEENHCLPY
jgi:hypothetical protein